MRKIDERYVEIETNDLRGFIITITRDYVLDYDEQYYIRTIIINDEYRIKLGDKIRVQGIAHTVNIIRRMQDSFFIITERITKTSQFILPALGGSYAEFNFKDSLYNCYLSKDYKYIYMVFKFSGNREYIMMEDRITSRNDFVEKYDPSPDIVVVKLVLPHTFKTDILKVVEGKYSRISATLKSKVCIFHGFDIKSKTYRMFYDNTGLRKEMEIEYGCTIPQEVDLMSKPIKKNELWIYQDISKKVGIEA